MGRRTTRTAVTIGVAAALFLFASSCSGGGARSGTGGTALRTHATPGLWVSDLNANTVTEYALASLPTKLSTLVTLTRQVSHPDSLAFDAAGDLWIADGGSPHPAVVEYRAASLTGGNPTPAARVNKGVGGAEGLAFDAHGNLWVATGGLVVEYAAASLASNPSPALTINSPSLDGPDALAFDAHGNLWVASYNNSSLVEFPVARRAGGSRPTIVIPIPSNPFDLAFDGHGNLWVVTHNGGIFEYTVPLASGVAPAASIATPSGGVVEGLAFDGRGDLWVTGSNGSQGVVYEYAAAALAEKPSSPSATLTTAGTSPWALAFFPKGAGVEAAPVATGSSTTRPSSGAPVATGSSTTRPSSGAPVVTGISPASGPTAGGTAVTVTGSNFTGANAVSFGPLPAGGFTVISDTEITATSTPYSAITGTPNPAGGTVDVTVNAPAGTSATSSADRFTYVAPPSPALASLAPASGPPGTTVTLEGSGFGTSPGRVTFTPVSGGQGLAATILHWSDTTIVCTVPSGLPAGPADPNVWSAAGLEAGPASDAAWPEFDVTSPPGQTPTITGLSPASAHMGAQFTITGTNLGNAPGGTVRFCDFCNATPGSDARVTSWTPTEIVGIVPGGLQCGGATVWVTVGGWRGRAGHIWMICGP